MPRRYFDLDNQTLQKQLTGTLVTEETARRGVDYPYDIQCVRAGVPVTLAADATGLFQLLVPGTYGTPQVVIAADCELVGTVYRFSPFILSTLLDAQLGNFLSATFDLQLQLTAGGLTFANSNAVEFTVLASKAAVSAAAVDVPLANVTRLTGGLPATDLDAQPLNGYAAGSVFSVAIDQGGEVYSESRWRKMAGTAATNAAAGVIRVSGYNAQTNAFILVRIAGA